MFAKSKIIRLTLWAFLAAVWLPIGNGLFQPAQAKAEEIIRVRPVYPVRPVVRVEPVVRVGPVLPAAPIVRVGPVYAHPWYGRYDVGYWHGYRWIR
jgi:hypothetical protein